MTLVIAGAGFLLPNGPIQATISLMIGGFAFCILAAATLEMVIEFIIGFRMLIIQGWQTHTPPYHDDPDSHLPVVDKGDSTAMAKAHKFGFWAIAIYFSMFLLSTYLAAEKPHWVLRFTNSQYVELAIALGFGLLQIPVNLVNSPWISEVIPKANTRWDAIVRFLLLVPATVVLIFSVANYRYVRAKQRARLYQRLQNQILGELRNGRIVWSEVPTDEKNIVYLDLALTILVIAFLVVNL